MAVYEITYEIEVTVNVYSEDFDNADAQAKAGLRADLSQHCVGGFTLLDWECLDDYEGDDGR